MMIIPCSPYGTYRTRKFVDIFPTANDFVTAFESTVFTGVLTTSDLNKAYYLIYARYGNSRVANSDENQAKYKIYSVLWQYGPTWARNVEVQATLRGLTENELVAGSKALTNHGYNPSTEIEGGPNPDDGEITTTNEQANTKYTKPKLEGYATLIALLEKDVTESFIKQFRICFLSITSAEEPLLYEGDN